MRRVLLLLAVLAAAGSAQGGPPAPVFTTTGNLAVVAASGPTAALGTVAHDTCPILLFRLARSAAPTQLRKPNPCNEESEAFVDELWLGRGT